jgi:ammonium transporter, Amt family
VRAKFAVRWSVAAVCILLPLAAAAGTRAAGAEALDSGDTAWLITATALVLLMTLPGLAAFYSGLVRTKNVLSIAMQCFAIACVVSVLWFLGGYSLAFGRTGPYSALIGPLDGLGLAAVGRDSLTARCRRPPSRCSSSPSRSSRRRWSWGLSPSG